MNSLPPCIAHEDDKLLVGRRPAKWPLNARSPHDPVGFTEWLRRREPRWEKLRLLKEIPGDDVALVAYAIGDARPELEEVSTSDSIELRTALISPDETNAYRLVHGAADGRPGDYVERLGEWLLWETEDAGATEPPIKAAGYRGVYRKLLRRHVRFTTADLAAPARVFGEAAPDRFPVRENGVRYLLSFVEGYSYGLFLDQRDNRRALLRGYLSPEFECFDGGLKGRSVLNAFAYTCAFSVCAGRAGAETTSLDLSRKYLDWGRANFEANGQDPAAHDFIYGDVFDWFRRMRNKGRVFDLVMLDPPTFSKSRKKGVFKVERDYAELVAMAAPLVAKDGVLFCSTNAAGWSAPKFRDAIGEGAHMASRRIANECFAGQPPDFPATPDQPAYLKTFWLRLD